MSECPKCHGLGYREFQAGLIRLRCSVCHGTGKAAATVEPTAEPRRRGRPKGSKNVPKGIDFDGCVL